MARGNLVIRRDLLSLTPKMIGQVRDPKIRAKLESVLDDAGSFPAAVRQTTLKRLCWKA